MASTETPPHQPAATRTAVVGAGLAGSLMAVYLARRGHRVDVYERHPDMRAHPELGGGRSINLALSTRGLRALEAVGLAEQVLADAIPMKGRMMHAVDGTLTFQAYGRADQAIQSVSRRGLNELLMTAAEEAGAAVHFEHPCTAYEPSTGALRFAGGDGADVAVDPDVVVAADGVYSAVRQRLQRQSRFDFEQLYLGHGYTELEIPPGPDGEFQLAPNYLHIWPRGDFMLIALPNADRSFTCTLFLAFEAEDGVSDPARDVVRAMRGEDPPDPADNAASARRDPRDCYAALGDEGAVRAFFERHFPDAVPLMPAYVEDMLERGGAPLCTIRCFPFHEGDHTVLIGDAAHAVVPFYGQGMNAAFEDCFELDRLLDTHAKAATADRAQVGRALRAFTASRKANADAIRELALYNFVVMRDSVASTRFLLRKKLEAWLHKLAPEAWVPLYTMVTFSHIPYAEAQARARKQERRLDRLIAGGVVVAAGLVAAAAAAASW